MKWHFMRKKKCGICERVLQEDATETIRYRVADQEEVQEMKICKECGDRLEAGALTKEDFDE